MIRGEVIQSIIDPSYSPKRQVIGLQLEKSKEEIIAEMREWFFSKFENPVNSCPHESSEGGYQSIWGGPYDAREELVSEFSGYHSDDIIEELIEELEKESFECSGKPQA